MHNLKLSGITYFILTSLLAFNLLVGCSVLPDEGNPLQSGTEEPKLPQAKTLSDSTEIELNSAIQKAAAGREDVLAFIIFRVTIDHVDSSEDRSLALVWISMVDKQTGLIQNSEPGLVIAHATGDASQPWRVTFQADPTFTEELMAVPEAMMSLDEKALYMPAVQQTSKDGTVYMGYKLPWTKGQTVYLTGSIGHVLTYKSCPSSCLYAFDFANGSMFDVKAAKHGYVKYAQWTYENGNTTNPNYLVLEDPSTTPTTYQVYYHLAQNSIPAALRVVGTEVMQGQFIGNADDTGYSTGNHLHFHVHTTPNSVWGNSVDIVFDDVTVNGGRPRTCAEAGAYPDYGSGCMDGNRYVSNNGDTATPIGAITNPVAYTTVTSPTINVSGWMNDDTAVASGQLKYNAGDGWVTIGEPVTVTPFTREIDLCGSRIPDGTFFLSIDVTDKAGKLSTGTQGLTELTKSYNCPVLPPVCTPAESQVALYTDIAYQGTCQVLDIGEYASLGNLTTSYLDNVKSLQVGAGVTALVYPDVDFGGTLELFQDGDSDLANNTTGSMNAASLKVISRVNAPQPPTLTLPETITANQDLTLGWSYGTGEQTRSTLSGADNYSQSLEWQEGGSWNVGQLAEGDYQWMVETRNLVGIASITQEFTVTEPVTTLLPLSHLNNLADITNSTAVELTWEIDEGSDAIDHFELQARPLGGEWAQYAVTEDSDARSMVFWGMPGGTYEFGLRAVGLTVGGEQYLSVPETSTMIVETCIEDDFETAVLNDDDLSVPSVIEIGGTQTHNWCTPYNPVTEVVGGDVDWVSFYATAGDELSFSTKPDSLASAALLTLYDLDSTTFLGEARPINADASASLDWTAPADGTYYMKLTPVDGRITGTDTSYEVAINVKSKVQPGTLICGSAAIPALLAGGYAASKVVKKEQKRRERKVMGR